MAAPGMVAYDNPPPVHAFSAEAMRRRLTRFD